jgi:hypothetical protein
LSQNALTQTQIQSFALNGYMVVSALVAEAEKARGEHSGGY